MKKHTCYTYFAVIGDVPADVFLSALSLREGQITVGKGKLELGKCRSYSVNLNDMYRETLSLLLGKEQILEELRHRYRLSYYLVAVPEIVSDSEEPTPILSLEPDIVEFLYRSGTEHDLDYYIL